MARLEQGANFDEVPIVDGNGNPVTTGGDSNSGGGGGRQPPKIGPKQIAIVGVLVVILIIVAVVMFGGKKEEEGPIGDTATPAPSETYEIEDPFADVMGDELEDPFPTGGSSDTESSSTQSGAQLIADPIANPYAYSFYTDEQVKALRGYGYTGDEIEYSAQNQRPYDELVDAAYKRYDKAYEEWRQTVLDESSQGYKDLMSKTYLGLPETRSDIKSEDVYRSSQHLENVDYEKIGTYNYQSWIMVHLSIGDVIMTMPTPRYAEIAESGNILISFSIAEDKDGNPLYISSIGEYRV